jgi:uncharacterized coiled-coil protein SlyX
MTEESGVKDNCVTITAGLAARIDTLEASLAFQEDALQALGQQLAYQQSVIEQQQRMLQTVYSQLKDVRASSDQEGSPQDVQEKPPHY